MLCSKCATTPMLLFVCLCLWTLKLFSLYTSTSTETINFSHNATNSFSYLYSTELNKAMTTSTLVETVSINYEDFTEGFLTCGTCLYTVSPSKLLFYI